MPTIIFPTIHLLRTTLRMFIALNHFVWRRLYRMAENRLHF